MSEADFDARRANERIYRLRPDATQIGPVPAHEPFVVHTMDSSGDQISEDVSLDELDLAQMFPVVGPIAIDGVRAGDAVGVEVRTLRLGPVAHTWTRPGLGFGRSISFHTRRLDTELPEIAWGSGDPIKVETRPHVGAIGVLPDHEEQARNLGAHGGNLDSPTLGEGATLWLAAQIDGGGVFAGDVHAAIGDGEICGTGAEAAADIELVVHTRRDWAPSLPTIVSADGRVSVIGIGDDFDAALTSAIDHCVEAMMVRQGMKEEDAYLAVGLLLQARVCQVVNPRVSVEVSLGSDLDHILIPEPLAPDRG